MRDDDSLAQFIETLCTTCRACPNLISLSPDTEDCEKCAHSKKRPLSQTSSGAAATTADGGSRCHSPDIPEKRCKTPSGGSGVSENINIKQEMPTSTTMANVTADSGISNSITMATSSTTTTTHFNQSNNTNEDTATTPSTPTSSTNINQNIHGNISSSSSSCSTINTNNNNTCYNDATNSIGANTNGGSSNSVLPNNVHIKVEPTIANTNGVQVSPGCYNTLHVYYNFLYDSFLADCYASTSFKTNTYTSFKCGQFK